MTSIGDIQRQARERLAAVSQELADAAPDLAENLDANADQLRRPGGEGGYGDLPAAVAGRAGEQAPEIAALYNRGLVASLIAGFDVTGCAFKLPASVLELYPRELARMLAQLDSQEPEFFDFARDPFVKDVAILTFRLIPIGAEFAESGSGIPRSVLLKGGVGQLLRGLAFVLFRAGGFRPYFSLHAHILSLEDFNPAGWELSYHRIAELLRLNPAVRGWISASWFLDPALKKISPHLTYLREVLEQNGAMLFFVERAPAGGGGALATSKTRRRLFEQGDYVPTVYMRVWPRKALLRWCARHPRADAA